jgi:hypothetical protein
MYSPKRVDAYCYGSNATVIRISPSVTLYAREQTKSPLIEVGMEPLTSKTISGFHFGDFYQYSTENFEIISTLPLVNEERRVALPHEPTNPLESCRSVRTYKSTDGRTVVILNDPTPFSAGKVLYEDGDCLVLLGI